MTTNRVLTSFLGAVFVFGLFGCAQVREVSGQTDGPQSKMTEEQLKRYARAERFLESTDSAMRQKAAVELLAMDHKRAREAVCGRIRNADDPAVRADMIQACAFTVEHRCFDAILDAIDASNQKVREAAASALSRFSRPDEVQKIKELFQASSTTPGTRRLLIEAIGRGMFVEAVPVLLKAMQSENKPVQEAAEIALQQVAGRDFGSDVERWKEWWERNKHRSREDILEERLWAMRAELDSARQRTDDLEAQLEEFAQLVRSASPATPKPLLKALLSPHRRVREYAAYRLSSMSKKELQSISLDDRETYEILHSAILRGQSIVRQDVVELVVSLEGTYRSALLLDALEDDHPGVLVTAIEGLSGNVGEAVVQQLESALDSSHGSVREAAANAIGRTGAEDAIPALIETLDDSEENVRWFAVESLRKLNAQQAVPRLCELVKNDESARVREIATTTLGELGQPAAVPCLRHALDDENERVQQKAVASLKALAGDGVERALVIADALREKTYSDAAADVLRKVIEEHADDEDMNEQVRQARTRLAQILKEQEKFLEAAEVYAELADGGDGDMRQQLVDCWILGKEPRRVVTAAEEWVTGTTGEALQKAVQSGMDAIQRLQKDHPDLAEETAGVLIPAAEKLEDEELLDKLRAMAGEEKTEETEEEEPPAEPAGGGVE